MDFHSHNKPRVPVRLRSAVFHLGTVPPFQRLANWGYSHIAHRCQRAIERIDGVESLELRGGSCQDCVPGVSDLDFSLRIAEDYQDRLEDLLGETREVYRGLRARYHIPGEVLVFTPLLESLLRKYPTPLGWYLGFHQRLSPQSRIGTAIQFYALATDSLIKRFRHGENSFYSEFFYRHTAKAGAVLGLEDSSELHSYSVPALMSKILTATLEQIPDSTPALELQATAPASLLEHCWIEQFNKVAGKSFRFLNSRLPYVLSFPEEESLEEIWTHYVEFLRTRPEIALRIPVLLLPKALHGLIEAGYLGWMTHPFVPPATGLTDLSRQALWERLLMWVPTLLGECLYSDEATVARHVQRFNDDWAALSQALPEVPQELIALRQCLSRAGFGSTVGVSSRGSNGETITSDSKHDSLSERIGRVGGHSA